MVPHGKELSEDLKRRIFVLYEDGQGYKKIANTLKLSCNTVSKIIQRFKRAGSTRNGPRVDRPKKLSARAERHIQMLSLKNRRRSAVSIAAEIEEVGDQPVCAQTIHCTLHEIGVHGCHYRLKPLLKTIHKKACKHFAEDMSTKHMDYWNHVLWSDEMKINLFGSDGFKHVWQWPGEEYKDKCVMPTVTHGGGNDIVWGSMSAAGVGELHFIEGNMYCEILQQSMIPSIQKLGRRAVFQHNNDPKHTSKTTTALLKRLRWWTGKASLELNPIEHLWGILKGKLEVHKVSNIRQLHYVVREEWKNIPVATCEVLVNSMPRRVKPVLDNDGGHTKYWQLLWWMLILTTFSKGCNHFCRQGFSF